MYAKVKNHLVYLNISIFLNKQIYLLPVLLLFYYANGLTAGDFFLFQGISALVMLIFTIPAGYAGDIFPRRRVLAFSYFLFLLRPLLWLFWGGYWIILVGEILYAFSRVFSNSVADSYIYDYLKQKGQAKLITRQYGKLNFAMSCGSLVAATSGAFLYDFLGVSVLLSWEVLVNTLAILMLFMLPEIPAAKDGKKLLTEKYKDLFVTAVKAWKDKRIKYQMLFSGAGKAMTSVFSWGFQPVMSMVALPVFLFSYVYFINHLCRAAAGLLAFRVISRIGMQRLGVLVYGLYLIAFGFFLMIIKFPSPELCLALLTLVCVIIGIELMYSIGNVSRIHALVSSDIRSTVSSVNQMAAQFLSAIVLISLKFVLDFMSLESAFAIYGAVFALSFYFLYKGRKYLHEPCQF